MEEPSADGPSPARKAQAALGKKLNRKPKQPPTLHDEPIRRNAPATHRSGSQDDVR